MRENWYKTAASGVLTEVNPEDDFRYDPYNATLGPIALAEDGEWRKMPAVVFAPELEAEILAGQALIIRVECRTTNGRGQFRYQTGKQHKSSWWESPTFDNTLEQWRENLKASFQTLLFYGIQPWLVKNFGAKPD